MLDTLSEGNAELCLALYDIDCSFPLFSPLIKYWLKGGASFNKQE